MFKDYDKYLSASLKVYLFVLVCVLILKLVGLDYFGLDLSNPTMLKISYFIDKYKLADLYYMVTLYFYSYMITSIICKDNSKSMKLYILIMLPIIFIIKYFDGLINNGWLMAIVDISFLFLLSFLYNLKDRKISMKTLIKDSLITIVMNTVFQLISASLRVNSFNGLQFGLIVNMILDLDYIMLLLIYQNIRLRKGGILCYQTEVGLFSQMKANLKNLPKRLQTNLHNFKKKSKQERLAISIYIFFSLLWNTFSLVVILLVANLNHTFVECIFILTSFWLSKRIFGKAFHLSSMAQCFVVSNLTYYFLNRITTPLGISILVPILLGVGLSYVTSKLVKKLYKPLYRGMPKDVFEETILQVVDKDSDKYKICYEYFVDKKSAIYLSMKYVYSEAGIRKIKDRVNKQIEKLN